MCLHSCVSFKFFYLFRLLFKHFLKFYEFLLIFLLGLILLFYIILLSRIFHTLKYDFNCFIRDFTSCTKNSLFFHDFLELFKLFNFNVNVSDIPVAIIVFFL